MIRVGILGGTGFGAGELLRLFSVHPEVSVEGVTSRSVGEKISTVHPHLASIYESSFVGELPDVDCVFSALPHGKSGKAISEVLGKQPGVKVVDLSGDLRLKGATLHQEYYGSEELPELRSNAVYGLTEANREAVGNAGLVSNPGCLATASILALLPFSGLHVRSVHQHGATGSSGSGKDPKATTHHPIRHANFLAYKALEHQHTPEVVQCLASNGSTITDLPFVAHSLPISRGILCTTFLELENRLDQEQIESLFSGYYQGKPFVRLKTTPAEIENVVGSNFCDISIKVKGNQIVIHTAIDNLVKGMAGQAIQNMNLMFGLSETTGLWFGGWRPV